MSAQDLRLDKWLWFARFCKSRSLAATWCDEGAVLVNGKPADKARGIRPGDEIEMPAGPKMRRTVRVVALGVRRGPAAEAQALYQELGRAACEPV